MRLTRIAAATLIAGSLTFAGTGIALADTPVTASSSTVSSSAAAQAAEPGVLMLSSTSVKPGTTVTFSGTMATPLTGTGPVTVTSPAFGGAATMNRTDPTAFSGSATVAAGTRAGTYTVTASSSAGTVSARLTVVGSGPAPVPPAPIHHGGTGTGTHTTGHGSSSGTENSGNTGTGTSDTTDTTGTTDSTGTVAAAVTDTDGSDALTWILGGLSAVAVIGGGAYAIGRGRGTGRTAHVDGQDAERDQEPRTEVMPRR